MTTLYRSTNVIIDAFEWHVMVRSKGGRTTIIYRFRPVSIRSVAYSALPQWKGPKPALLVHFAKYRSHIDDALASEALRKEAAVSLQRRGRVDEARASL